MSVCLSHCHKSIKVRDRAWFVRLYGEIIPELNGIICRIGAQTILYLTCTMISSVDLAHYGVFRAKDWVFVDCGTSLSNVLLLSVKRLLKIRFIYLFIFANSKEK